MHWSHTSLIGVTACHVLDGGAQGLPVCGPVIKRGVATFSGVLYQLYGIVTDAETALACRTFNTLDVDAVYDVSADP